MERHSRLNRFLAAAGVVLIWFPILAPVILGSIRFISDGIFRFDYLMPAELFFVVLAGGILLIWTAFRTRTYHKLITWSFAACLMFLTISMLLAQVTGLASGAYPPEGWRFALVLGTYFLFLAALIISAVGGVLLMIRLFRKSRL